MKKLISASFLAIALTLTGTTVKVERESLLSNQRKAVRRQREMHALIEDALRRLPMRDDREAAADSANNKADVPRAALLRLHLPRLRRLSDSALY